MIIFLENDNLRMLRSLLFKVWIITLIASFLGSFLTVKGILVYKIFFIFNALLFILVYGHHLFNDEIVLNIGKQVRRSFSFFLIWLGYAGFSLMWAANTNDCLKYIGFVFGAAYLVYFSIFYLKTQKRWDYSVIIIGAVIGFFCMIGLWETFTGNHIQTAAAEILPANKMNTPLAIYVNPNDFATCLALFFPFILSMIETKKSLILRFLAVLICAVSFFLIVQTDSRANIISLFIGIFLFIALSAKKTRFYFILGLILIAFYLLLFKSEFFTGFYQEISFQLNSLKTKDSASIGIRESLIINGFAMLADSFFMGVGAGNHASKMIQYQNLNETGDVMKMHNFWMEILTDYGAIIFILFVFLYLNTLYKLYRLFQEADSMYLQVTSKSLFIAMVMFSISVISSSSVIPARIVWIFWGLALAFINIHYSQACASSPVKEATQSLMLQEKV